MKKRFIMLFAVMAMLFCLPIIANAQIVDSGNCGAQGDNVSYILDDAGTLTINGTGDMESYYTDSVVPWNRRRGNIKSVIIGSGVTSIGSWSFCDCGILTSVTISDTVTRLGNGAFSGCQNLPSITMPDSVTSLGNGAFAACKGLTSVTIPDSVTSADLYAFSNCTSLTSATVGGGLTDLPASMFHNCVKLTTVTISDGVQTIGNSAFNDCTDLTSITIPDTVTSIENSAFNGCDSLTDVYYNSNFEDFEKLNIGSHNSSFTSAKKHCKDIVYDECGKCGNNLMYFFDYDGTLTIRGTGDMSDYSSSHPAWYSKRLKITNVVIESGVTSIGASAFYDCGSLTSVTISDSVTSIGNYSFSGCTELTDIYYDGTARDFSKIAVSSFTNAVLHCSDIPTNGKILNDCIYWFEGDGVLHITGTGDMKSYTANSHSPFYNNTDIKSVVLDGVTSIGAYTFDGCANLTSVTIPDSVTSIGVDAFNDCGGLISVTIPESVTSIGAYAFKDCSILDLYYNAVNCTMSVYNNKYGFSECRINRLHIGDKVESLPNYAFYGSSGLVSVIIPDSVTSIGDSAFKDGTSLTTITIPESVTSIGSSAFEGCTSLTGITIPESVTSIGSSAFGGCTSLANITIPDNITDISNSAFNNTAYYNDETNWENGVLYIGNLLIRANADMLPSEYTVKQGTKTIAHSAFYGCTSLTSITLPPSITHIGANAFFCIDYAPPTGTGNPPWPYYNGKLTNVYITDLAAWCNICFSKNGNVPSPMYEFRSSNPLEFAHNLYLNGRLVTDLVIPDGITKISDYTFTDCENLTSVTIPGSVTSIGDYAFSGCGLTSVTIPDGVTSIGDYAFGCRGLTSVTIPESVTNIGNYAFGSALKNIYISSVDWLFKYRELLKNNSSASIIGLQSAIVPAEYETVDLQLNNCINLKSIVIPASVKSISSNAFSGCTNIKSVYIDKSVNNIGASAFESCDKLTDVYYGGSEEEWFLLPISSGNGNLLNATIHYNSDIPSAAPEVDPDPSDDPTPTPIPTPNPDVVNTSADTYTISRIQPTESGVELTIQTNETVSGKQVVMVACYDENNVFTGLEWRQITASAGEQTIIVDIDKENTSSVKAFIWNALDYMMPASHPADLKL